MIYNKLNIHYLDLSKNITLKYNNALPTSTLIYFTLLKDLSESLNFNFKNHHKINH